jgi:hypothetical protein
VSAPTQGTRLRSARNGQRPERPLREGTTRVPRGASRPTPAEEVIAHARATRAGDRSPGRAPNSTLRRRGPGQAATSLRRCDPHGARDRARRTCRTRRARSLPSPRAPGRARPGRGGGELSGDRTPSASARARRCADRAVRRAPAPRGGARGRAGRAEVRAGRAGRRVVAACECTWPVATRAL